MEVRFLKRATLTARHDPLTDSIRVQSLGVGVASSGVNGVISLPTPALPTASGQIGMSAAGEVLMFVGGGVVSVLTSGGSAHAALRQLIHLAEQGPMEAWPSGVYRAITPAASLFPTAVRWYTDNTATVKILEKLITRDSLQRATTIQWVMYDTDGTTVLASVTDTVTYTGLIETSRVRTIA